MECELMIQEELQAMVVNDNIKHPFKGMKEAKRHAQGFIDFNPANMDEARELINQESKLHPHFLFEEAYAELESETMFFPATKDFNYLSKHSIAE